MVATRARAQTLADDDRDIPARSVEGELVTQYVPALRYMRFTVDGIDVDPGSVVVQQTTNANADQPRDEHGRWAAAGAALGERIGRGEAGDREIEQHLADGYKAGVPHDAIHHAAKGLNRRLASHERGEVIGDVARAERAVPLAPPSGIKYQFAAPKEIPRLSATSSPLPTGAPADVTHELSERAGRAETTHDQIEEHFAGLRKLPKAEQKALAGMLSARDLKKAQERVHHRLGHAERGLEIAAIARAGQNT